MTDNPDDVSADPVLHALQNHLSIIVGFCDLLLADLPESARPRQDIQQIHKAGQAAIALLPDVAARMRASK